MDNVIEREWVVEKIDRQTGLMSAIGKVIPKEKTLFFNNEDLEVIWDLANWGVSQPTQFLPNCEVYRDCKCFLRRDYPSLGYVDLGKTSCCNDDIFIRRHYDTEVGFWIKSNRRENRDEWVYSSRREFISFNS